MEVTLVQELSVTLLKLTILFFPPAIRFLRDSLIHRVNSKDTASSQRFNNLPLVFRGICISLMLPGVKNG